MPGIHEGTQREKKEGGRWRKEVDTEASLEGVNEREREREGHRKIEIVSGL